MTSKIWPMLALVLAAPSLVSAQGPEGGPPRPDFAALQRREADDMALLLGLRPEQRPALTAYLQSFAPPPPRDGRPPQGPMSPGADTAGADMAGPDAAGTDTAGDDFGKQLKRMTDMAARRSADDTRRIAAARTFYDALNSTQRAAFEALMRLRHGPPMMMGAPPMMGPMMGGAMMGHPMMGSAMGGMPGGPMHDRPIPGAPGDPVPR